jgi:hypothetical protein
MSTPLLNSKPPTGPAAAKVNGNANGANGMHHVSTGSTGGISTKPICKHFQKVCYATTQFHQVDQLLTRK